MPGRPAGVLRRRERRAGGEVRRGYDVDRDARRGPYLAAGAFSAGTGAPAYGSSYSREMSLFV